MLAKQHLKTAAAITLAAGAIAAPAASAHSPPPDPTCPRCCSPAAEPTIVHLDSNSGFDWLDAGIGAAGGVAISIAAVGGVLIISQRRGRAHAVRPQSSTDDQ
jgi:hypothetical protein